MPVMIADKNAELIGKRQFASCLLLGVGYAATIGGMATLIGTPVNAILVAQLSSIFPESPGIDFFAWITFALPFAAFFLLITWFWLTSVTNRKMPDVISGSRDVIGNNLKELGSLTTGEKWTLLIFISVAFAWIFRTPKEIGSLVIPGINTYIPGVTDATIAICGALILFMLPVDAKNGIFTLDWHSAKEIPWGILILIGGGICLSEGIIQSGLAELIANLFVHAERPLVVIIFLTVLFITFLNEVLSNTATASIMIPLMAITAVSRGINPMMLMVPATLASSLGFMLPVGTPPNAIAFGTGYISMKEMMRAGFALDIIGCILITLFMTFIIPAVLGITPELPAWAVIPEI